MTRIDYDAELSEMFVRLIAVPVGAARQKYSQETPLPLTRPDITLLE